MPAYCNRVKGSWGIAQRSSENGPQTGNGTESALLENEEDSFGKDSPSRVYSLRVYSYRILQVSRGNKKVSQATDAPLNSLAIVLSLLSHYQPRPSLSFLPSPVGHKVSLSVLYVCLIVSFSFVSFSVTLSLSLSLHSISFSLPSSPSLIQSLSPSLPLAPSALSLSLSVTPSFSLIPFFSPSSRPSFPPSLPCSPLFLATC